MLDLIYTDEKILIYVKKFYESYLHMPTKEEFEDKSYGVPIELYIHIFYNWDNVIEATCNLFYEDYKLCSKCNKLFPKSNVYFRKNKNAIDQLNYQCVFCEEKKKLNKKIKQTVVKKDINVDSKVKNVTPKKIVKASQKKLFEDYEKQLFEAIQNFYNEDYYLPTEDEFRKYKTNINIDIFIKRFSSWNNILKLFKKEFYSEYKFCPCCQKLLPPNNIFFAKDKTTNDGFQCWCKECKSKERKERYRKDKRTGKYKEYYEENRLRHIASGFTKRGFPNITETDLQKIIDNFKNKHGKSICPYCGREIQDERDIQFDHFIPYYKKIKNISLTNLIPVCKYCNRSKWDDDFEEWYKEQNFYNPISEQYLLKYVNGHNINQAYDYINQYEQYIEVSNQINTQTCL